MISPAISTVLVLATGGLSLMLIFTLLSLARCKKIFDLYKDQIALLRDSQELSEMKQELLQLKLDWYQSKYGDIPSTGSPPQKEETSSP